MAVDFSNQWYRETCKEAGYNPDNLLSQSEIDLARLSAVNMKKYTDIKEKYGDEKLKEKLIVEIKRLDEKRVEHMLNALDFAKIAAGLGKGFESFLEKHFSEKRRLLKK